MTDLDPIYQTLLAAAAPAIVNALNALPAARQSQVAAAYESGGWPEIQVGVLNEAAYCRLIVRNVDGIEHELARVDHWPH